MTPRASIVVVTYQCREAALACLESVYRDTQRVTFEVVVVDNGSTDGTVEAIGERFPDVRLVALERNVGFAAGVNAGAKTTVGDYLILLNPDTVATGDAVSNIVRFAEANPEYGLYGGRTLDPDGTPHPGSCWGKPTVWSLFCFATGLSKAFRRSPIFDPESLGRWERDTVREVDIVTGCLLLVRRSLWEQLGGFDERFFMYGEDADLALRVQAAGLRNVVTPDAVVLHEIGVSSSSRGDKLQLLFRGKATLLRKHWLPGKRELGLGLLVMGVGLRAAAAGLAREGRPGDATSGWAALWRTRRAWVGGYGRSGTAEA